MFRWGGKKLELIPYESGATKVLELPRDRLIKSIDLRLDMTDTISGGTTSGTVLSYAVCKLIDYIEVQADGNITLFKMDGRGLYLKNLLHTGTPGFIDNPADGDTGAEVIGVQLTIPFENNIGKYPADTYLLASAYRTLNLIIKWNPCTAMFSSTHDRVHTVTAGGGITPILYDTTEPTPEFLRFQGYTDKIVSATASEFYMDINVGARIYQEFMFGATDADVLESDIINYFSLIAGDKFNYFSNIPDDYVLSKNKAQFGLETALAGFYNFQMTENGLITSGFSVADFNSAKWNLNVTVGSGTTNIRMYHDYLIRA